MITKEIFYEDALREDYRIAINEKVVELSVRKECGQAVFEMGNCNSPLEPHEQHLLMDEMRTISIDFLARRAFGQFSLSKKKSIKK